MNLENIQVNAQSSICIRGSQVLYFDPFRINNEMGDADLIFVTHEHFDHFEPASIERIRKEDSILIAPASMQKKVLQETTFQAANCVFLEPGDTKNLNGVEIMAIPAYNNAKPFHQKHKKWLGYVVKLDEITYYVAGDTDATEANRSVQCDVALVPIGGTYTMNREQAAEYILKLNPKAVVPTHYGDVAGKPEDGEVFEGLVSANSTIQVEIKL